MPCGILGCGRGTPPEKFDDYEIFTNEIEPYFSYLLYSRREDKIPTPKTHIPSEDILNYVINKREKIKEKG